MDFRDIYRKGVFYEAEHFEETNKVIDRKVFKPALTALAASTKAVCKGIPKVDSTNINATIISIIDYACKNAVSYGSRASDIKKLPNSQVLIKENIGIVGEVFGSYGVDKEMLVAILKIWNVELDTFTFSTLINEYNKAYQKYNSNQGVLSSGLKDKAKDIYVNAKSSKEIYYDGQIQNTEDPQTKERIIAEKELAFISPKKLEDLKNLVGMTEEDIEKALPNVFSQELGWIYNAYDKDAHFEDFSGNKTKSIPAKEFVQAIIDEESPKKTEERIGELKETDFLKGIDAIAKFARLKMEGAKKTNASEIIEGAKAEGLQRDEKHVNIIESMKSNRNSILFKNLITKIGEIFGQHMISMGWVKAILSELEVHYSPVELQKLEDAHDKEYSKAKGENDKLLIKIKNRAAKIYTDARAEALQNKKYLPTEKDLEEISKLLELSPKDIENRVDSDLFTNINPGLDWITDAYVNANKSELDVGSNKSNLNNFSARVYIEVILDSEEKLLRNAAKTELDDPKKAWQEIIEDFNSLIKSYEEIMKSKEMRKLVRDNPNLAAPLKHAGGVISGISLAFGGLLAAFSAIVPGGVQYASYFSGLAKHGRRIGKLLSNAGSPLKADATKKLKNKEKDKSDKEDKKEDKETSKLYNDIYGKD